MNKLPIVSWDILLPRCKGIYLLTDEDGKHYVGQSKNVRNRIYEHRYMLNYAYLHPEERISYNQRLIRAARDGMHFKASVLRLFDDNATGKEISFWEYYYINKYGGLYLSYNIEPPYRYCFDSPKGHHGRYVLKPEDARKVESCKDAESACKYLDSLTDYIEIDEHLLRVAESIPKGLKSIP